MALRKELTAIVLLVFIVVLAFPMFQNYRVYSTSDCLELVFSAPAYDLSLDSEITITVDILPDPDISLDTGRQIHVQLRDVGGIDAAGKPYIDCEKFLKLQPLYTHG